MEEEKPVKESLQRIAFECQESGATKWQVLKIIKELEAAEGNEAQLRKKASEILEKLNPEAAKTFISFERLRVFTSREKLEAFDRGNIIRSLLKETGVSRAVAEKIGGEVEDKIKDLKISYLNTQLIREMVGVKLLEYGHEAIHSDYARIGLPVFEVRKKLEAGLFENPEILREYNWLKAIPAEARQLHFESTIHVYAPEDYSTKIFCASEFIAGEKEEIALAAAKKDRVLTMPLALKAMNFSLAHAKAGKKLFEEFSSTQKIFSVTGKKRFCELALYTGQEWELHAAGKKNAVALANHALQQKSPALEFCVAIDSKYQLKLLEKKCLGTGLTILNNSREKNSVHGLGPVPGTKPVLQAVGINLPKAAESAMGRENGFMQKIREISETITALAEKKKEILRKKNYFEGWMGQSETAVCLAGIAIACGQLSSGEPEKIAEQAISEFQRHGFAVLGMHSGEAAEKFGLGVEKPAEQEMLLRMNARQKRSYGFVYEAQSLKEAEALLGECPCVKLGPQNEQQG